MNVYDKLSDPIALTVFLLTLIFPIIIGLLAMLGTKNQSDFLVGGRKMNKFVVALSAISSGRSSWLVLGVSGMAYTMGSSAIWAIVGYITVEALQFVYLGKKLRIDTENQDSLTLLDYFEEKFEDKKHTIRITGAVIITLFITAYVAAQFNAGAKTLSTALEIPFFLSLIISAALILVYMTLGGFVAVAYNDVVRAIIMLIGLVLLPVVGIVKLGGVGVMVDILSQLNPKFIDPLAISFGAMIGFIGIGLGSPGQPHIVVRYLSIDDSEKLKQSAIIGTIWNIILGIGAVTIGLVGRAIFAEQNMLPNSDPEMIYLVLSSKYFGSVFYGLLIGGVFAAILSTADSQLLVVASTFVRDIYEKIIASGRIIAEDKKMSINRWVVIASGIVAVLLALVAKDLVFWLVLFAWGGLGASFGPALILSVYSKGINKIGIVAGMISGSLITIIWKLWFKTETGIYELIPAFFGSMIIILLVSKLSKQK